MKRKRIKMFSSVVMASDITPLAIYYVVKQVSVQ